MKHDLYRFSGNHIPRAAILIIRGSLGTHTGIIYRDRNDALRILDFHLDGRIVDEPWRGRYPHVIPNTDDDALDTLAGLCQVVADRYRGRPPEHLFGFRMSPQAFINPVTGELYLGESVGATCASFVLLVLGQACIDLVTTGPDWPHRPADDARHTQLFAMLEQRFPDPNYLTRVAADLPCPRVAPEEVAGAGMCPNPPAEQSFAERAARWILDLFDHNQRHGV
jgi:hypothetical protein